MANDLNNNHTITKTPTVADPITITYQAKGGTSVVKDFTNIDAARAFWVEKQRNGMSPVMKQD